MSSKAWLALAGLALCACGGGGGGGDGGGSGGTDNSWLTFTPSPIQVSTYEGESPEFIVTVRSSKTIAEPLNMAIVDSVGVITTEVSITAASPTEYGVALHVAPTLAAGAHSGALEVRLCRDDPAVCRNAYPGSPWRVPYQFTVRSGTNLSPLRPLAGAGAWTTYQGNASHTGHVPANVDPANFSRRFAWPNAGSSVTVEDGRVFVVSGNRGSSTVPWNLRAISEASGQVLWTTSMGTLFQVNPPAVSNGKVYATSTGHADTYFWTFDATTGAQLARTAMSSQWETYLAPTVHAGKVYTNSGTYGGLSRFDAATSAFDWYVSLYQFDQWTPAVDGNYVVAHAGSRLSVLRPLDGSVVTTIDDPRFDWSGYSMYGAPVLDGLGNVYATQYGSTSGSGPRGRLLKFDLAQGTLAWDLSQSFHSNPVLANGVLYVVNGNNFEARSPAGALLWSWAAPEGFSREWGKTSPVVVVGNHAFVGTTNATHAVDLRTRQSVWSYPASGPLAVSSNGVLYISGSNSLIAINLQ